MALTQDLRHALRAVVSPSSYKELSALLDAGVYLHTSSLQLRTDLNSIMSPQAARELIAGFASGGIASPTQPLRTALTTLLGYGPGSEFITALAPADDGDDSSSSSGEE
jgi:hypothetical protein